MTKEEIIRAIKEKKNVGVYITSISGTNLENELNNWKYYLFKDRDYDGDTLYCINFFYCTRNGFEATKAYYSSYSENEVNDEMYRIASETESMSIKFSNESEIFVA